MAPLRVTSTAGTGICSRKYTSLAGNCRGFTRKRCFEESAVRSSNNNCVLSVTHAREFVGYAADFESQMSYTGVGAFSIIWFIDRPCLGGGGRKRIDVVKKGSHGGVSIIATIPTLTP